MSVVTTYHIFVFALFLVQGGMWTAVHIPPCTRKKNIYIFRDYRILSYKGEETRLRVLEMRLLGRILLEKKEDVTEAMKKLHN